MRFNTVAWATFALLLLPLGVAQAAPKFTASSSKATSTEDNGPDKVFDGLLNTSWAEDKPGRGIGEWFEVDFGEDTEIGKLSIWGGSFAGREEWNARGRTAEVSLVGKDSKGNAVYEQEVVFGDRYQRKDVSVDATIRTLRLTLDEVHEGAIFAETHVAEIAFDLSKKADPAWHDAIDKAIAKSRTLKEAPAAAVEELDTAFAACKVEEDYSRNFKLIGWYAAHGPQYLVELVQKYVPVGHRLKMLRFNEDAIDMLGRLRDANAIPYLEIAAAGASSADDRDWLLGSVAYFRAYQDLRRTPRATVPNWGSTGMESGAFMGRGEPIAISADSSGNVWVADVGNNRVQRLTAAGTSDLIIGAPERAIVESWFGDDSEPYAAAAAAGTEPGTFTQPVHISVGNYDIAMVIDAEMNVQTFDSEGAPLKQWKVDTPWRPRSGTGSGTPVITWYGDDFYVIVKDEVFTYNAEGELKNRYTLEGGTVQCGVIAAGGRLLVRHVGSRELTEYKPEDGFRQGSWLRKPVPDDGSEDWDMATDEKDNVYVVTDAGNVFKWNKRARFVTKIQVFENARNVPRIAVFDTIIYVSAKDEVTRVVQED